MKKIFLLAASIVVFNPLFSIFNSLQAQGFDWHRFNITADFSFQPSLLHHGSGILKNHPERAFHAGINYRIARHWEVGLYADLVGATAWQSAYERHGDVVVWRMLGFTNQYQVGFGTLVQFHSVSFEKRNRVGIDMILRLGMDLYETEADRFWGGVGFIHRFSRHMAVTFSTDFGTFYYGRQHDMITGVDSWHLRTSVGVQVEL